MWVVDDVLVVMVHEHNNDEWYNTNNAAGLSRSSFDVQEVEDYFNYMGMLAAEGTYDRLEKMLECTLNECWFDDRFCLFCTK